MTRELESLLARLWDDYARMNPQAGRIHALLAARGEEIANDHIAFRTYGDPRVGIDALSRVFLEDGYVPGGEYIFPEKKLFARHLDPPREGLPKVFVSELRLDLCSDPLRRTVEGLLAQVSGDLPARRDFCASGRPWAVTHAAYEELRRESEYAAWLAGFGFRANHFTVLVNDLSTFPDLAALNDFLKENGFALNAEGGEIKGSPDVYLEQSSTKAAPVAVDFADGRFEIPGCYYEFARRHPLPDGTLFSGFVEKSADKIFESTDKKTS